MKGCFEQTNIKAIARAQSYIVDILQLCTKRFYSSFIMETEGYGAELYAEVCFSRTL